MKILPEPIAFEWDKGNIDKNLTKHDVTNQEAEEVFSNRPLLLNEDKNHSSQEVRYQALGETHQKRLLFVSFTTRSQKVRLISFRDMNIKERGEYEKIKINS